MVFLSELPEARACLIRTLQELHYGRIEGLIVRDGQPILDPMPRIVAEHKFGGDHGLPAEVERADFALRKQVTDLCQRLDQLGDGVIEVLTVKDGLPFSMQVCTASTRH